TQVSLHFTVKGFGDLTFTTGTLQVSFDVTSMNVNQASSGSEDGVVTPVSAYFDDPTAPYATALAVPPGQGLVQGFTVVPEGAWALLGVNEVCMPVQITQVLAPGTTDGFSLRLAQLNGGQGQLCIFDAGTMNDRLVIDALRIGAPPAGQESFLPAP